MRGTCTACGQPRCNAGRTTCYACKIDLKRSAWSPEVRDARVALDEARQRAMEANRATRAQEILKIIEPILTKRGGSLQAAGEALGMTRERVRQLIRDYPELQHLSADHRAAARLKAREEAP